MTPINTYVFPDDPDASIYFRYEDCVSIKGEEKPFYAEMVDVPLGEVFISPNVLEAMEENPDDAVCYVFISYIPITDRPY